MPTMESTKRSGTQLADLMTPNPVVVDEATTLDDAIRILNNYTFRHLPVVACDRLVGILSDRDLRLATSWLPEARRLWDDSGHPVPGPRSVGEIMKRDVQAAAPTDEAVEAARRMVESRIGALPILEASRVIGIVTETNLLEAFVGSGRGARGADSEVRHHLHADCGAIDAECSVLEALEQLDPNLGHFPVQSDGVLCGIVSDRDLMMGLSRCMISDARAQEDGHLVDATIPVKQVMSARVITVGPDTTLGDAARRMLGHRFSALPVVEDDCLLGLITQRDLLEHFAAGC